MKFKPRRTGDIDAYYAATYLAKRLIGWRSIRTIYEMCVDHWRWQSNDPGRVSLNRTYEAHMDRRLTREVVAKRRLRPSSRLGASIVRDETRRDNRANRWRQTPTSRARRRPRQQCRCMFSARLHGPTRLSRFRCPGEWVGSGRARPSTIRKFRRAASSQGVDQIHRRPQRGDSPAEGSVRSVSRLLGAICTFSRR
jgi:hypothetical protein